MITTVNNEHCSFVILAPLNLKDDINAEDEDDHEDDNDDDDDGGSFGVSDGRCLNLILRTKKSPSQPS